MQARNARTVNRFVPSRATVPATRFACTNSGTTSTAPMVFTLT